MTTEKKLIVVCIGADQSGIEAALIHHNVDRRQVVFVDTVEKAKELAEDEMFKNMDSIIVKPRMNEYLIQAMPQVEMKPIFIAPKIHPKHQNKYRNRR